MRRLLRLIDVLPSTIPVFVPATYAVTVAVNWEVLQRQRAWSQSQIFVTHSDQYELWGEGLAASSGLAHFVKVRAWEMNRNHPKRALFPGTTDAFQGREEMSRNDS